MNQFDSRINYQFLYHVLPDPVVVIDRTGTIVDLNVSAKDAFPKFSIGHKIEDLFIDRKKIKANILELFQYHKVITDKAIVKTIGSKIQPYEYKITILSESNDLFLIAFNSLIIKNELLKLEFEQTFSTELHALMPYLNKAGKDLVAKKIKAKKINILFEAGLKQDESFKISDLEFKNKIKSSFPTFSESEINLAYFMAMKANTKQLATIINKDANAIRVMIYRMLAKTSFGDRIEFIDYINNMN